MSSPNFRVKTVLKMGFKKCTQSIAKSTNFQNPMKHSPFL